MNGDMNSHERRTMLLTAQDEPNADQEHRSVEFPLPSGWFIAQSDEERILLFPDDAAELAACAFVPNVIIELRYEEPVAAGSPADPPVVLTSPGDREDDGSTRTLRISIDETSEGESVHHLTGRRSRGGATATATCTALEVQWAQVAAAFDQIVDHLDVGGPEGATTNGD